MSSVKARKFATRSRPVTSTTSRDDLDVLDGWALRALDLDADEAVLAGVSSEYLVPVVYDSGFRFGIFRRRRLSNVFEPVKRLLLRHQTVRAEHPELDRKWRLTSNDPPKMQALLSEAAIRDSLLRDSSLVFLKLQRPYDPMTHLLFGDWRFDQLYGKFYHPDLSVTSLSDDEAIIELFQATLDYLEDTGSIRRPEHIQSPDLE